MNHVWLVGDTHLGHHNILKYQKNRAFYDIEEHDYTIIEKLATTIGKKDTFIHLGDVAFQREKIALFDEIKCLRKILIMGNHDTFPHELYTDVFDKVYGVFEKKGYVFTHIPIHENQFYRFKGNIHGHVHHAEFISHKHYNVCLDRIRDYPVKMAEVIS